MCLAGFPHLVEFGIKVLDGNHGMLHLDFVLFEVIRSMHTANFWLFSFFDQA